MQFKVFPVIWDSVFNQLSDITTVPDHDSSGAFAPEAIHAIKVLGLHVFTYRPGTVPSNRDRSFLCVIDDVFSSIRDGDRK